jgi:PLP dependent protein
MDQLAERIRGNLERILEQIDSAASKAGRSGKDVQLIVVSKAQPIEILQAAIDVGIEKFGENYPDETLAKIQKLSSFPNIEWHMIGHLQSRKIDIVARHFHMFQALDSLHLAEKLNQKLLALNKEMPVLLEFNVSGEDSKFGLPAWDEQKWDGLAAELNNIFVLGNLRIAGLMTMPPFFEESNLTRPFFKRLRNLQDFLRGKFPGQKFEELSMGTSGDYEIAVQEGATIVRIGQAILGPRYLKN